MEYLLIGGSRDGHQIRKEGMPGALNFPVLERIGCILSEDRTSMFATELYTLRTIYGEGGKPFHFYALESLNYNQIVEKLLKFYKHD